MNVYRNLPGLIRTQVSLMSSGSAPFTYVQGQYNKHDDKIREYFYSVDHNGQLFLDDARMKNFTSCFKEVKFLRFFYSRIRRTEPQDNLVHEHFRYTSHCGVERNYVRVDATPFVFTRLESGRLEFNGTGLTVGFEPSSLYVGSDGRVYHTFDHRFVKFGLVRSSVADLISLNFDYHGVDDGKRPIAYRSNGDAIKLDYRLRDMVEEALVLR